jgi:hypothetical protein
MKRWPLALGRVHGGSGLHPFTSPSYPGAKAAQPLVDQAGMGSGN